MPGAMCFYLKYAGEASSIDEAFLFVVNKSCKWVFNKVFTQGKPQTAIFQLVKS